MAELEDFYPEIERVVKGVPGPTLDAQILAACIEFCEKTHIWVETLQSIGVIANKAEYDLTLPTGSRIIAPRSMIHVDKEIRPLTEDDLNINSPGWRTATANRASNFVMLSPIRIRLVPVPTESAARGLHTIKVALKPTRSATTVPDILLEDYYEAIGHGAKARLLAIPKEPWSHPPTSKYHDELFEEAISDAAMRRFKSFSRGAPDVPARRLPGCP